MLHIIDAVHKPEGKEIDKEVMRERSCMIHSHVLQLSVGMSFERRTGQMIFRTGKVMLPDYRQKKEAHRFKVLAQLKGRYQ